LGVGVVRPGRVYDMHDLGRLIKSDGTDFWVTGPQGVSRLSMSAEVIKDYPISNMRGLMIYRLGLAS
jgi:hypothetical protein